jgi:serine/threonine protein kinase
MDHPNIAKVLDAGATETGRPFFVMELVRGIRITDYCDQNNLSTSQRLELFMQVCRAIQHAHQKGIIHRDIKPSNILVTLHDGLPVPKVIDFGIAKAMDQRLTDKTLFTQFEQFIGTPAYMSPEQAEMTGLDIDTRSDIYSLGVLLYELLTSRTPFDSKELLAAGLDAMRRLIREQEPPKPSTRLSTMLDGDLTTVAKRRHALPPKLIHLIRGDLDWIVMKALEKDRTRRYETASGFAGDIQHFLTNEPVVARPAPSIACGKWCGATVWPLPPPAPSARPFSSAWWFPPGCSCAKKRPAGWLTARRSTTNRWRCFWKTCSRASVRRSPWGVTRRCCGRFWTRPSSG